MFTCFSCFNFEYFCCLLLNSCFSSFFSTKQFNDDDYDDEEGNGQSQDSFDEIDEDLVPAEANGNITGGKRPFPR